MIDHGAFREITRCLVPAIVMKVDNTVCFVMDNYHSINDIKNKVFCKEIRFIVFTHRNLYCSCYNILYYYTSLIVRA